jgi:hypothetical protein
MIFPYSKVQMIINTTWTIYFFTGNEQTYLCNHNFNLSYNNLNDKALLNCLVSTVA